MGFRKSIEEKDWGGPFADLIYTVYLLLKDAAEILALMGIGAALKALLELMKTPPITVYGETIEVGQILKNYDYTLLFAFLVIQGYRLLKSMIS